MAQVKQYDFFTSLIFFQQHQQSVFRGASRAFFSGASGAVRFFQWCPPISFSGTGEAVQFFHQFDFFFSGAPAERVSEVPAELFSVALVEQFDFFSDACQFFSVAQVKQYNFDVHNNHWCQVHIT